MPTLSRGTPVLAISNDLTAVTTGLLGHRCLINASTISGDTQRGQHPFNIDTMYRQTHSTHNNQRRMLNPESDTLLLMSLVAVFGPLLVLLAFSIPVLSSWVFFGAGMTYLLHVLDRSSDQPAGFPDSRDGPASRHLWTPGSLRGKLQGEEQH